MADAIGHGIDVERIVRQVLAQLHGQQTVGGSASSPGRRELLVDAKVVSLAELPQGWDAAQRVVLRQGAIVTPAVLDALRERNIAISWAPIDGTHPQHVRHAVVVGQANTDFDSAGLLRSLSKQVVEIERLAQTGLMTVTEEISDAVAMGGKLGLLLTRSVPAGVCLANRRRGVRAAAADNLAGVEAAIAGLGVNLLVVDPTRRGAFELQKMAARFLSGGQRKCPAELQDRLH